LCRDLGFTKRDRDENIRRIAFLSNLLTRNGIVVLVAAISPYREARDQARLIIGDFAEVFVSTPLDICELRDPKDLYRKARSGRIHGFTGVDDPYEPPLAPDIICAADRESTRESSAKVVRAVLDYLSSRKSLLTVIPSTVNRPPPR
jgi:adenylylsulfate kinase